MGNYFIKVDKDPLSHESYLIHHGILGQKWGKKNGPPYPLDFDKLSSEERSKAKEDSINNGDLETATKNKKHYSNEELEQVIKRFEMNKKLEEVSKKYIKDGFQKAEDLSKKFQTVANLMQSGTTMYNNIAKISNSLNGSNLPIIGDTNKGVSVSNEYKNGKLISKTTVSKNGNSSYTKTERFEEDKDKDKKTSFKDQKDIDMIINNISNYTDDELSEMAKRSKNIGKIKNTFRNSNDGKD